MNFLQGMEYRSFGRRVSLSIGVPFGEPGDGVRLEGTVRDSGRTPEIEYVSLRELC
jgi:hypothetical protein